MGDELFCSTKVSRAVANGDDNDKALAEKEAEVSHYHYHNRNTIYQ